MSDVIIYPTQTSIAIMSPAVECGLTTNEIALKDVPAGKPYLIVSTDTFPSDNFFIDAWTADFSNPDGHGIGHVAWFASRGAAT